MTVLAWHFLAGPLPGVLRDGRPAPADGEILRHNGSLVLCEQGLHASVRVLDAVNYAPGAIVCRVECGGLVQHDDDKLVCTERTILWRADAEMTLRAFARWCALSVMHLWDPPQVVRDYLETGREELGAAAEAAAWAASVSASAAWNAAWASAWAVASDAAWAVAKAAQNVRLEEMLLALAPAGGAQYQGPALKAERDEAHKEVEHQKERGDRMAERADRALAERDEARALVFDLFARDCNVADAFNGETPRYDHMCSATCEEAQAKLIAWGLVKREECVRD